MTYMQIIKTHFHPWSDKEKCVCLFLILLISSIVIILKAKKKISLVQAIATIVFFIYLTQIFATTVFTRDYTSQRFALEPFWSWKLAIQGDIDLKIEIILNIIMFIPVGLMIPLILADRIKLYHGLLFGFLISLTVESCQLIFRCGLFETDDLIGNSFGCMLGCALMLLIKKIVKNIRKHW